MTRILVATTNPAKLSEYRLLLRGLDLEVISLADARIGETPEETGATFRENALLKARFYFGRINLPTLADDGGLEVDALGGAPGVHSHRWLGSDQATDRALADAIIRRMEGVEKPRRTARLRAAVALIFKERSVVREALAEDAIEGMIAPRAYPEIRPGFPYRAVLWLPDRGCYLAELGEQEEARLSQRRKSVAKLRPELETIAAAGGTPYDVPD
jgi:XTP/dITP diphosphohydrolase